MIIGSLAGPLCAGGGFCAGSEEVVEHQRISAASYTFSAALPAMLATTASETINMLQEDSGMELISTLRENIKSMRAQLDPRSDWVRCTSSPENPIMLLVLKKEVIENKKLSVQDQEFLLQDAVDEVRFLLLSRGERGGANITRRHWQTACLLPASRACLRRWVRVLETSRGSRSPPSRCASPLACRNERRRRRAW